MPNEPMKVPQVPINEPSPIVGRIAWHIENAFIRFGKRVFNGIADSFRSLLAFSLSQFLDIIEPGILSATGPVLDQMIAMPGLDEATKQSIIKVRRGDNQSDALLAIPYAMLGIMGLITGPVSILARVSSHAVDEVYRSNRPTPDALWAMMRRGAIQPDQFNDAMKEMGWANYFISGWGEISQALVPGGDLGQAFLRGTLSEEDFVRELGNRGYTGLSIQVIQELLKVIPGPQDLIRMAVREAWDDSIAHQFGYDDNFPAEFAEWSQKIGLSADWAKRFWRAHWELPGVREGFEMVHRRIIDEGELDLLMRARDISSFWRERLMQVSYRPYNRVDVRRMYREGVVTEQEVFESYLDLGYDETKASKLTEWTIKAYTQEGRDLAKSDILGAYKDSTISQEEAFAYLIMLEYGEDEALMLLARVDIKKESAYEKELIQNVRVAFVGNVIEENDVFIQLGTINPPAGFVEERLKLWRLQRQRSLKKPTLTMLRDFWLTDVIDRVTLEKELSGQGYNKKYVGWFIEFWTAKAEEE